ncbi:MAG TPA: methyltransferase domain-containing protein [Terriglobales bacterium]|nr:methyltransferase domain-containing protein [Terriglobales bacterium]
MPADRDNERFHSGAQKYAAYLETPDGRLRSDLAFANIEDFLPAQAKQSLHALDIGSGTGATAIRLAKLGIHVTMLDSSPEMLEIAERAANEDCVLAKVTLKQGDAAQLPQFFPPGSFDLVLCHNVLEYVNEPESVLSAAARALRNSASVLSVLVRSQAGEVLKSAITNGDLDAAEESLTAEWGHESLYGGRVRLFSTHILRRMLKAASLAVIAERGVRVVADYLPLTVSRNQEYDRILKMECKLGARPEFAAIARYAHFIARRSGPGVEDRS